MSGDKKFDDKYLKKNYDYNKDETVNPTYEKICSNLADEYVLKKKIIQIKQSQRDRAVKQMNKEEVLKTAQKVFVGNKPYVTFMGNLKEEDIPSYEVILKLLTF